MTHTAFSPEGRRQREDALREMRSRWALLKTLRGRLRASAARTARGGTEIVEIVLTREELAVWTTDREFRLEFERIVRIVAGQYGLRVVVTREPEDEFDGVFQSGVLLKYPKR